MDIVKSTRGDSLSFIDPDDQQMQIVLNIIGSRVDTLSNPLAKNDELCSSMIEFGKLLIKIGESGLPK